MTQNIMSKGHVSQSRVGKDTIYIVPVSEYFVPLGDETPIDFPDTSSNNVEDSAGSSLRTNKETVMEFSQKRE